MKKKINLKTCCVEFIPRELDSDTIYISEKFGTAIHLCLCGCGNKSVTPFGNNYHSWELIQGEKGITFKPSILNTNCPNKAHYVITNGAANIL